MSPSLQPLLVRCFDVDTVIFMILGFGFCFVPLILDVVSEGILFNQYF